MRMTLMKVVPVLIPPLRFQRRWISNTPFSETESVS